METTRGGGQDRRVEQLLNRLMSTLETTPDAVVGRLSVNFGILNQNMNERLRANQVELQRSINSVANRVNAITASVLDCLQQRLEAQTRVFVESIQSLEAEQLPRVIELLENAQDALTEIENSLFGVAAEEEPGEIGISDTDIGLNVGIQKRSSEQQIGVSIGLVSNGFNKPKIEARVNVQVGDMRHQPGQGPYLNARIKHKKVLASYEKGFINDEYTKQRVGIELPNTATSVNVTRLVNESSKVVKPTYSVGLSLPYKGQTDFTFETNAEMSLLEGKGQMERKLKSPRAKSQQFTVKRKDTEVMNNKGMTPHEGGTHGRLNGSPSSDFGSLTLAHRQEPTQGVLPMTKSMSADTVSGYRIPSFSSEVVGAFIIVLGLFSLKYRKNDS